MELISFLLFLQVGEGEGGGQREEGGVDVNVVGVLCVCVCVCVRKGREVDLAALVVPRGKMRKCNEWSI